MPMTSDINPVVLCEKVLGWEKGRVFWQAPGSAKLEANPPDFLNNISAAWMLAVAASKKYKCQVQLSYDPATGEYAAWFPHARVVSDRDAVALTRAVWALVQEKGEVA